MQFTKKTLSAALATALGVASPALAQELAPPAIDQPAQVVPV